jgi:tRNA pseudouridine55 synthase
MYSALKKDGKALYDYARAGIEVERDAARTSRSTLCTLEEIEPEGARKAFAIIRVRCSKGTYIRTLARRHW